ncbi:hypothetical protein LJB81_04425 [Desulfovibrio sp. OttesenSCG-928-M14]|nr:hypothetical protein [Desulfovibrio sp. OttesenSCG-928-M14]
MATQNLCTQTTEGKCHLAASPIVSYTSKDGRHVGLDDLRHNLDSIANDIDLAEMIAEESGDHEFAQALNAVFHDVDGLIPAAPGQGAHHE